MEAHNMRLWCGWDHLVHARDMLGKRPLRYRSILVEKSAHDAKRRCSAVHYP